MVFLFFLRPPIGTIIIHDECKLWYWSLVRDCNGPLVYQILASKANSLRNWKSFEILINKINTRFYIRENTGQGHAWQFQYAAACGIRLIVNMLLLMWSSKVHLVHNMSRHDWQIRRTLFWAERLQVFMVILFSWISFQYIPL